MARLRIKLGSDGRPSAAVVALSRRNLLALLHKIERPGSTGGIFNTDVEIDGDYAPGFAFVVLGEDDVDHYAQRSEPPGPMRAQTESFIRSRGGWSKTDG